MSDLLTRLGERALEVRDGVRPMIAPLFLSGSSWPVSEPPRPTDGSGGHEEAVVLDNAPAATSTEPGASPAIDRDLVSTRQSADAGTSARDEAHGRQSAPPHRARSREMPLVTERPSLSRPNGQAPPAPDEVGPGPDEVAWGAREAAAPAEPAASAAIPMASTRIAHDAGRAASRPGPGPITRASERSDDEGEMRRAEPAPSRPERAMAAPRRRAGEAMPAPAAQRAVADTLARLRAAGAAQVPARAAGEPAATERVVRISIGRIDVRAVSAPAPAATVTRPRVPAPPQLSLNEYLAKKRRGPA